MLKKNTAAYANVIPIQGALWGCNGQVSLVDPGLGYWGFQTSHLAADKVSSGEHVLGITLQKLMADQSIDYVDILKVDIEGSEKEMFETSSPWIERVGVVVIELHDRFKNGCSRTVYLATRNFEHEWRRGETVFLARKEYVNGLPQTPFAGYLDRKTNGYRIVGTISG